MADYYDYLIGEHARGVRCRYRHGYTVAETTCPTVLALVKQQEAARRTKPSPYRSATDAQPPRGEE